MNKAIIACILSITLLTIIGCMNGKRKKVIFFGDSITQFAVEPGGYIDLLNKKLEAGNESENYELVGSGVSANKVYDLYLRMDNDVLSKRPEAVVIWIGVNDVWHKTSLGTGTDADKFAKFYSALIQKMQAENIQLILTTPAVIGEKYDGSNVQDADMDLYANIIRQLAIQYHCGLCDLRESFMTYEKKNNPGNKSAGILTTDGVHLNAAGNAFVADAMLESIKKIFANE